MNILAAFKPIKLFVLDVDGVLTDGTLLVLNDGQMARRMSIKDGYALQLAVKKGYRFLIISGGADEAVKMRLQNLGISSVFMNVTNKKEVLLQYVTSENLLWPEVLYMGDDIPDFATMQMAGVACCPADAVPEIKAISNYISPLNGGQGCVRDVIEKVLKLNNHWNDDGTTASK
ncbi:MAG: 3-deoxy-D-manno-octulosonate 8-phosphate phosphatase [Gloeobacteraceae cyanobacterium ES-bin-316]|nr:3-deoxy-D-manno-octulosonate 8-phosphate phosphatase [Ferruginibacter sp.]